MNDESNEVDQIISFDPITLEEITVEHSGTITHDHEFGFLPIAVFIVLIFWISSLDTEIRCALGSEKACASLKIEQSKPKPTEG